MKISIVTGASSGIGEKFVTLLDKIEDCDEIWLVARNTERLCEVSAKISKPTKVMGLDLSKNESIEELSALLKESNHEITSLVCSAGFGKIGEFTEIPLAEQLNMIDLNCKALTAITYICLPYMKSGSKIYEIASKAGFQPVPYLATYSASKAYVLSFSRAINKELKSRGIRVISVCPGWTQTNFLGRAEEKGKLKYDKFYTPEDVASSAILDMDKGRDVSAPGLLTKANRLASKIIPHSLVMDIWCKMQKK